VFNLESSGVEALDWRPRHDEQCVFRKNGTVISLTDGQQFR
jgi:hypothetical protein